MKQIISKEQRELTLSQLKGKNSFVLFLLLSSIVFFASSVGVFLKGGISPFFCLILTSSAFLLFIANNFSADLEKIKNWKTFSTQRDFCLSFEKEPRECLKRNAIFLSERQIASLFFMIDKQNGDVMKVYKIIKGLKTEGHLCE